MIPRTQRLLAFGVVVLATILGFAATDLVLPAVPLLPQALSGTRSGRCRRRRCWCSRWLRGPRAARTR